MKKRPGLAHFKKEHLSSEHILIRSRCHIFLPLHSYQLFFNGPAHFKAIQMVQTKKKTRCVCQVLNGLGVVASIYFTAQASEHHSTELKHKSKFRCLKLVSFYRHLWHRRPVCNTNCLHPLVKTMKMYKTAFPLWLSTFF